MRGMQDRIRLRVTLEVDLPSEARAEEFGWLLNLLRAELSRKPEWTGKIRQTSFLSSSKSSS